MCGVLLPGSANKDKRRSLPGQGAPGLLPTLDPSLDASSCFWIYPPGAFPSAKVAGAYLAAVHIQVLVLVSPDLVSLSKSLNLPMPQFPPL